MREKYRGVLGHDVKQKLLAIAQGKALPDADAADSELLLLTQESRILRLEVDKGSCVSQRVSPCGSRHGPLFVQGESGGGGIWVSASVCR